MKHLLLHPVDPGNATVPVSCDRLEGWINRLPGWFSNPAIPSPKATLLCGLPGTGKASAAKTIARTLDRPLFRLEPACDAASLAEINTLLGVDNQPCVLWVENPGEIHTSLHSRILDAETSPAFVVFTTTRPHRLPEVFVRSDIIESVWHMDLPDMRQRSAIWGELLSAVLPGFHEHDSVKLSQLSPMFTPGEIHASLTMAIRESGGKPDAGILVDAVLALRPIAHSMDESLACLRRWATVHAVEAASKSDRSEQ